MKQTAVEFLIKEFSEILGPIDTKPMQDLLIMDAMKQAKEMEKQQIENAWVNGYNCRTSEDKIGGSGNEEKEYYEENHNPDWKGDPNDPNRWNGW